MRRKQIRLLVDIGMVLLLPLLMAYSLIGELPHEILGTAMTVLFVLHLVQNGRWLLAIPKGRYTARRTFQTVLDLLLLVFMILQPVSGILLSKHLFTFLRVPGVSSLMRQIHMAGAYWGFVLMSVHGGTHLLPLVRSLQKRSWPAQAAVVLVGVGVCAYGAWAFSQRQMPSYLSFRTMFAFFDFSESRVRFLLDHLAILVLFAVLGLGLTALFAKIDQNRIKEGN